MLYEFRVADGQQWQLLRPRIRHVSGNRQELLEKAEKAKRRSGNLPLKTEVDRQRQRN